MTVDGVNRKVHNTGTHTCVHADSQAEAPVHTDTHAHTRTGTQAHQTTVCMQARPCACARAHNVVTQLHSTHQPCHRPVDLQALLLAQSNTHTYLHTHVLTRTHTYTHTRTHTHTHAHRHIHTRAHLLLLLQQRVQRWLRVLHGRGLEVGVVEVVCSAHKQSQHVE
jgi:hypothetical protein